ncbi:MAG: hypothetical protein QW707_08370 [Candidatus Bathyarchaeia archaeon]
MRDSGMEAENRQTVVLTIDEFEELLTMVKTAVRLLEKRKRGRVDG